MATMETFVFLWHWNDFLWPLVIMRDPNNYMLTVGLNSLQAQESLLATVMAAATVTFLPAFLVFILLQRFFIRGVMMSGLSRAGAHTGRDPDLDHQSSSLRGLGQEQAPDEERPAPAVR